MTEKTKVDGIVIGGGVIGCAIASVFLQAHPDSSLVVLEAGPRIAEGITSRNSGVIHAGIYYPPSSLKASLCVRGNALLYEWADKHGVPYKKIGKLIIANNAKQEVILEATLANAVSSGARDLKIISREQVKALEPELNAHSAIWSAGTGIIDPYSLTKSFLEDAKMRGAVLLTGNEVKSITRLGADYEVTTVKESILAPVVFNAAGLFADDVAAMAGVKKYTIYPWRGDYFKLRTSAKFKHLIYPVKDPGAAGLGVHLTIDLNGELKLGPDVEPAKSKTDFSPTSEKEAAFLAAAKRLFGGDMPDALNIPEMKLEYDYCGIRPKLREPGEKDEKDFIVSRDLPGFVNLIGIESPGLTASIALAETAVGLL